MVTGVVGESGRFPCTVTLVAGPAVGSLGLEKFTHAYSVVPLCTVTGLWSAGSLKQRGSRLKAIVKAKWTVVVAAWAPGAPNRAARRVTRNHSQARFRV